MSVLAPLRSLVQLNANRKALQTAFSCCLTLLGLLACFGVSATAQTAPVQIPFLPKYEVLTVVYAPPGSASSVTYGNSSLVGSSNSFLTSTSNSVTESTSTTTGFSLFGLGSSTTNTSSDGWGDSYQGSSSLSVQTTNGNSVTTAGPISSALGVNHDNDVIYIWLNPVVMASTPIPAPATISLTWTGLDFNSCDLTDSGDAVNAEQMVNGCDPNQYPFPDIIGVPVWCLKNPYYPGQSCAQWLAFTSRSWDLTPWGGSTTTAPPPGPMLTLQDYADILQADPFVTQTLVPATWTSGYYCHPTYGVNLDPNDTETILSGSQINGNGKSPISGKQFPINFCGTPGATMQRFDPYNTIEYPEPGINGEPQTYSGNFAYTTTSTAGSSSTTTSTQGNSTSTTNSFQSPSGVAIAALAGAQAGTQNFLNVLGAGFNFSITNSSSYTWSWAQTNATTDTSSTTSSASYSVTGPQLSDNYQGPTTFNVYKDNVMGTFAFYSDQQRQQLPIVVANSASCGAPICVEQSSGTLISTLTFTGNVPVSPTTPPTLPITLVNNSNYPITMVGPAVTFSDPAFSIVANSDYCSNELLPPGGPCTVSIQFSPVIADAPNSIHSTYPVTANLIAAGTENISSYQNILVTSTGVLATGVATPVSTESIGATLLPATSNTAQANIYNFGAYTGGQTEIFTFKNYNSGAATISASPKGVALSDSIDFSIVSDGCSGVTVPALTGTCTLKVQYMPPTSVGATGIVVVGTVPGAPTGSVPVPLATAAAVGTLGTATFSITPSTSLSFSGNSSSQPPPQTITIKNTGVIPLVIAGTSVNAPTFSVADTTTCSASTPLAAGSTCTFTVTVTVPQNTTCYECTPGGYLQVTGSNNGNTLVTTLVSVALTDTDPTFTLRMSGAEQNREVTVPGKQATASFVIGEAPAPSARKVDLPVAGVSGMTLIIGGYTYQARMSGMAILQSQSPASLMAGVINGSQGPVTATASGNSIQLVSTVAGTSGNIPFTISSSGSLVASPSSGSLTGGTNPTTTTQYDNGTVTLTGGGVTVSTQWGEGSTPSTIAQSLATALSAVAKGRFTATASGSVVSIIPLSGEMPKVNVTVESLEGFSPASFSAAVEQ